MQYEKFEKPTEATEKAVAEIFRHNAESHNQEESTLSSPKHEENQKMEFATDCNEDTHDGLAQVSTSDGTVIIFFKNFLNNT